jgi:hypothetical protein
MASFSLVGFENAQRFSQKNVGKGSRVENGIVKNGDIETTDKDIGAGCSMQMSKAH